VDKQTTDLTAICWAESKYKYDHVFFILVLKWTRGLSSIQLLSEFLVFGVSLQCVKTKWQQKTENGEHLETTYPGTPWWPRGKFSSSSIMLA